MITALLTRPQSPTGSQSLPFPTSTSVVPSPRCASVGERPPHSPSKAHCLRCRGVACHEDVKLGDLHAAYLAGLFLYRRRHEGSSPCDPVPRVSQAWSYSRSASDWISAAIVSRSRHADGIASTP